VFLDVESISTIVATAVENVKRLETHLPKLLVDIVEVLLHQHDQEVWSVKKFLVHSSTTDLV
jgi:hypothetical protein